MIKHLSKAFRTSICYTIPISAKFNFISPKKQTFKRRKAGSLKLWSKAEKLFTFVHKGGKEKEKEKGNKVFLQKNYIEQNKKKTN